MNNYISYTDLLWNRSEFRKSGTWSADDFNILDSPGHKYFKILFYFNSGDVVKQTDIESSSGLLTPTWLLPDDKKKEELLYQYNSAWSYLKLNYEDERAALLEDFVNLLSNINSNSPWYFSEITGLDTAIDRKMMMEENFTIAPTRPKITIKCLHDSADDRIGTLLDLYRAIAFSWTRKCEMLPANLRKFDMGIFVFETPNATFNRESNICVGGYPEHSYKTSYKYYELHNCEIDYSSSKALSVTLNNTEGSNPEYNIEIFFDDCYEIRYNEFLMKELGDFIINDIESWENNAPDAKGENKNDYSKDASASRELNDRMNWYGDARGGDVADVPGTPEAEQKKSAWQNIKDKAKAQAKKALDNATNQLIGTAANYINSKITRALLGNLYTFSLTRIGDQLKAAANGDIWSTMRAVNEYVTDAKHRRGQASITDANLFDGPQNSKKIIPQVKKMGNLAKGNTIANNI